ncbi:MAG: hypothetical protein OQK13_04320, partial [Gammaproteobacteria bacterium]|nr:hypothetical protein [Gammaproteobacteria bacterium]
YDSQSQMEEPFFQNVNLQSDKSRLHGIRNVHLLKGSTMADIITIKGVLIVTLPAEIETFTLSSSNIGKQFEAQALSVNLRTMESRSLTIEVSGLDARRRLLGAVAISDSSPEASTQTPRSWGTTENGDKLRFSYDFDQPFDRAEIYVANQIDEKHNSFSLTQKSTVIELD